jgi:hypothetical protein
MTYKGFLSYDTKSVIIEVDIYIFRRTFLRRGWRSDGKSGFEGIGAACEIRPSVDAAGMLLVSPWHSGAVALGIVSVVLCATLILL